MSFESNVLGLGPGRVVAVGTEGVVGKIAVLSTRAGMDLVTHQARPFVLSVNDDPSNGVEDVPVRRIYLGSIGQPPIEFEITEQVVSGDEVMRVGKTGAGGLAAAEMALPAQGRHFPRRIMPAPGEPHQARVIGVLRRTVAVTHEAVEGWASKRSGWPLDRRGMATRASFGELLGMPLELARQFRLPSPLADADPWTAQQLGPAVFRRFP